MKINLHKPNISIQIDNCANVKHQSTPVSIRNRKEPRHISRFTSSLEYIAKLHTLSNSKHLNQTPPPERIQSKAFISPNETIKVKTGTNSPSKLMETPHSLGATVLSFLDSMTTLQEAISRKEASVPLLKKEFELNKKLLLSSALSSLSRNKPIQIMPNQKILLPSPCNEIRLKEEIKKLKEEISSIKTKQRKQGSVNSQSTCNISLSAIHKRHQSTATQTESGLLQNCFNILKDTYNLLREKERAYSIDFNYDTNPSLYFNKNSPMNDTQLIGSCLLIYTELVAIINKLSDNFDKIKTSLNATVSSLREDAKKSKAQLNEFKKVINDYLKQFHDVNSSLYSSEDLLKIFKKNSAKVLTDLGQKEQRKEEFEKDLKSYKIMSETYKQALEDSQLKASNLERELEEAKARLINQGESETIKNDSQEDALLNQIAQLKNELKESREKELNGSPVEVIPSISNALTKLVLEINITAKAKEYFYVIFKLIGFNDEQINDVYVMKEKKKKYLTLFKAS